MGFIPFQPSRFESNPEIQHYDVEGTATLTIGEVVQRDTNEQLVEPHAGGATVTGILGVSMGATSSAGTPAIGDKMPICIARRDTLFIGTVWDVSASEVADVSVAEHEGVQFGIIEDSGKWYVDEEDTTNVVLRVVKALTQINAVLFRFIGSAIEGA